MDKINTQDIEKLLENLNASFDPITKEIDKGLNFLYECIGENPHTDFKEITIDDIKEA